jgi:PHD/YefM family antitoxin component YafN of YafNO toxin-antitoxin module
MRIEGSQKLARKVAIVEISPKTVPDKLASAISRVADTGERVVLTRRRKGVAALVSMEDLAVLERLEDEADLRAARKARKEKGSVSLAEVKKRLGMK